MKKTIIPKSRLRDYFMKNYCLDIVWLEQINGVGCNKQKAYFGVLIKLHTQLCFNFLYYPGVSDFPHVSHLGDSCQNCMREMKSLISSYLLSMAAEL